MNEPIQEEIQEPEPEREPEAEPERQETTEEYNRRLYEGLSPKEAQRFYRAMMKMNRGSFWGALFRHYFKF